MPLDLEHCRKDAKTLVRAFRAGEREAVARAEAVLGGRAWERFVLSDAQHVVAVERGFRTWPELKRRAEARTEEIVETGLEYLPDEPVRVRIVRRGRRIGLSDDGRAVELARLQPGWYEDAERFVREVWSLNLSRRGVVIVPVTGGRAVEPLVRRVAETSLALCQELLDLSA